LIMWIVESQWAMCSAGRSGAAVLSVRSWLHCCWKASSWVWIIPEHSSTTGGQRH